MAYQINYSPESSSRYPQSQKKYHIDWVKCTVLCLLLLTALWVRINGIPDFLIPGDPQITRSAAETMVADIRAGEKLENAVTVFCKEILNGAG